MSGLYIHIPFCAAKCSYCAFYSEAGYGKEKMDSYCDAVCNSIKAWSEKLSHVFDTVYIGGGTPSFFGKNRLSRILSCVRESFCVAENAEITIECNPSTVDEELVKALSEAGVNRISMGLQSAVGAERRLLSRKSDTDSAARAVSLFRDYGIDNISLDLMLGIPGQTLSSLDETVHFILSQNVKHVSAYILKLEEGTPLFEKRKQLDFPDEDEVCELYLRAAELLEREGIKQYEVSNFAVPGYESRHNVNYWSCGEYLGIGAAAHSFITGKRFFYESSTDSFIEGKSPIPDGDGGDEEEYIMLRLRLTEGLSDKDFFDRFNRHIPERVFMRAKELEKADLLTVKDKTITLTKKGFLVSNSVICELCMELL